MRKLFLALAMTVGMLVGPASAQDGPLKIGVLGDMSGLWSSSSGKGSIAAVELAIEDFGPTVLGRKIEIVSGDHQNKSDLGAAIVRRWFEDENVSMVTDVIGSAVALAVQGEARRANRIAMYTGAGSSDLTGKECSPTGFVWTLDTHALTLSVTNALLSQGLKNWYFLTPDFVFGHQAEEVATKVVEAAGGKVLGSSKFPMNNQDFSSLLLAAQASKAQVIVMTGGDVAAAMKQAVEFGVVQQGQKLATVLLWLPLVKGIGTKIGQGTYVTNSFYWDLNDETRAWSKRYFDKVGAMPTMNHAGTYSATLHYLQAIQKAGSADAEAVAKAMREMPVSDATAKGVVRADGLFQRDFFLWQIKSPEESTGEWDLLKLVSRIPAEQAALPLAESECSLVRK